MIFACQTLEFSRANELDHLELFAGDCSVTRGELSDRGSSTKKVLLSPKSLSMVGNQIKGQTIVGIHH